MFNQFDRQPNLHSVPLRPESKRDPNLGRLINAIQLGRGNVQDILMEVVRPVRLKLVAEAKGRPVPPPAELTTRIKELVVKMVKSNLAITEEMVASGIEALVRKACGFESSEANMAAAA